MRTMPGCVIVSQLVHCSRLVQVSLEEPQVPSVHRVGQALVRVEDEAQRYMPSQASLEEGASLAFHSTCEC